MGKKGKSGGGKGKGILVGSKGKGTGGKGKVRVVRERVRVSKVKDKEVRETVAVRERVRG